MGDLVPNSAPHLKRRSVLGPRPLAKMATDVLADVVDVALAAITTIAAAVADVACTVFAVVAIVSLRQAFIPIGALQCDLHR